MPALEAQSVSHNNSHYGWAPVLVAGAVSGALAGAVATCLLFRVPRYHFTHPDEKQHWKKEHVTASSAEPCLARGKYNYSEQQLSAATDADVIVAVGVSPNRGQERKANFATFPTLDARDWTDGQVACTPSTTIPSRSLVPPQSPQHIAGRRDPTDPTPRVGSLSWDDYFMALAFLSAERSKDPNKQVGAVIVNTDNVILGIGYNGFPRGCCDRELPWAKVGHHSDGRPDPLATKYPYVVHAEANALLNKNSASVAGARIYVTMFPCNECAKLLIQAGIREVVYHEDKVLHLEKPGAAASGTCAVKQVVSTTGGAGVPSSCTTAAAGGAGCPRPGRDRDQPPPSTGQQKREQHWHQQQQLQQPSALANGRVPPTPLSPCIPLPGDSDVDEADAFDPSATKVSSLRALRGDDADPSTPGSSSRPSPASLAATAGLAPGSATASAAASTPTMDPSSPQPHNPASTTAGPCTPSTAVEATTPGGLAATCPAAGGADLDADGAPWSGFWSHPRDGGAVALHDMTPGSSGSPVLVCTPPSRPTSAQILSSWARSEPPSPRKDDAPGVTPSSSQGAPESPTVPASGAAAGAAAGGGNGSKSGAAATGVDVAYRASLRLLRMSGVTLRQHKLQRVITIPGPAALSG